MSGARPKFFENFELAVDPILGVYGGGADGVIRSTNCAMAPHFTSFGIS